MHILEDAENSKLKTETTTTYIKFRNADLVAGMYLQFTLPSIYSGKYSSSSVANYNFKWAKNIASALIKSVSLI